MLADPRDKCGWLQHKLESVGYKHVKLYHKAVYGFVSLRYTSWASDGGED